VFCLHVQQEPPEELDRIQMYHRPLSGLGVIFDGEADPAVMEIHQAVIGDGDAVRVPS
jgi:hypothetical protein